MLPQINQLLLAVLIFACGSVFFMRMAYKIDPTVRNLIFYVISVLVLASTIVDCFI